jgi:hypothetical protein
VPACCAARALSLSLSFSPSPSPSLACGQALSADAHKTRYWVAVPRGLHPLRPNHVSCLTALLSHG